MRLATTLAFFALLIVISYAPASALPTFTLRRVGPAVQGADFFYRREINFTVTGNEEQMRQFRKFPRVSLRSFFTVFL